MKQEWVKQGLLYLISLLKNKWCIGSSLVLHHKLAIFSTSLYFIVKINFTLSLLLILQEVQMVGNHIYNKKTNGDVWHHTKVFPVCYFATDSLILFI